MESDWVISSLMSLGVPTPLYPNEVYNWTIEAPALAIFKASSPDEIPPQPIMGIEAGRSGRRVCSAMRDSGNRGRPDKPPI